MKSTTAPELMENIIDKDRTFGLALIKIWMEDNFSIFWNITHILP